MFLAIDIGNTNTTFGCFDNENLLFKVSMKTDPERTPDEFLPFFSSIFNNRNHALSDIKQVVISCVVPLALANIKSFFVKYLNINPLTIDQIYHNVNIDNKELGADLIANAVAVAHLFRRDCIIIDCGTVTTVSLLECNYTMLRYKGVSISPGFNSFMSCMSHNAAQLPSVHFNKVKTVLGSTTSEAINAGICFGFVGMIEHLVSTIKIEHQLPLTVIMTGGSSQLFIDMIKSVDIFEPNLTLLGIKYAYLLNKYIV